MSSFEQWWYLAADPTRTDVEDTRMHELALHIQEEEWPDQWLPTPVLRDVP